MNDDFKWWKKEKVLWGTMPLLDGTSEENQEHDVNTDNNIPRIGSLWSTILVLKLQPI